MIQSYLRSWRSFNPDVRQYLGTTALIGLTASSGIFGVLLSLYLLHLGHNPEFIGAVNAVNPFASAAFCLPANAIGRRLNYRRAIMIGVALLVFGYGLLPLAEFVPPKLEKAWLLTTYLVSGLGMALYNVNLSPALVESTTNRERNYVFALRIALMPLAGFVGSLIGGLLPGWFASALNLPLDAPDAYRYALWIGALLLCPALWIAWAARLQPPGSQPSGNAAANPGMRTLSKAMPLGLISFVALAGFLRVAGEGPAQAFFNIYLDTVLRMTPAQIGTLAAVGRLLSIPAALLAPLVMARWGNASTVVWGALGVTAGLLPIALIPHWATAGLGFMTMTGLAAVSRSAFMVFSLEAVAPPWRGTMSAATTMAASLSWGLFALIGGYLIAPLGYRGLFMLGACVTGIGALLFGWRFDRRLYQNRWSKEGT